jgi:C-3',4' desaturase CrtD
MAEFERYDAIVIGAGVAGLTAAAELTLRNVRTLVVERHNVPGGCASFYQRDGYRFDVGATLIGGFGARGVHRILNARLGIDVSPELVEPSMVVHFPDEIVVRYGDGRWAGERLRAFGPGAEPFFRRAERIADLAWDLSTRAPALPADVPGALALVRAFRPRHGALLATLGRTVASIMPRDSSQLLRTFVDAQLLITAQTDAAHADLAYGATALDLAREGTFHLADGVSTISVGLARAIRSRGGRILYNHSVREISIRGRRVRGVVLADGRSIEARRAIVALPLHDAVRLAPELEPHYRVRLASSPQRWGAFTVYVGLPPGIVPEGLPAHHQIVSSYDAPLGEGNSTFLSFSGPRERRRARGGGRAVTISTHTDVARWERARAEGREPALRAAYARRLLDALDSIVPGASARAELIEPATPHTFARYTGRHRGLVGGLPQTPSHATLGALSHHTPIHGLYLAGDETFPGQSSVGTTLSGLAAAKAAAWRL